MCVKSEFGVPAEIQLVEWLRAAQKTSQCPLDPFQQTLHLFLLTALCFHWSFSSLSSALQGAARTCPVSVRAKLSLFWQFFAWQHGDDGSGSFKKQSIGRHETYDTYKLTRDILPSDNGEEIPATGLPPESLVRDHQVVVWRGSHRVTSVALFPKVDREAWNCHQRVVEAFPGLIVHHRRPRELVWFQCGQNWAWFDNFFLSQHRDESSGPIWWIWVASRNFCSPLSLAMIIMMLVATFLGAKLTCSTVNDSLME